MEITRGKIVGAQKIIIDGPEGIGKTSLAAIFPNSVFIDTEGSTKHLDVARTPNPSSWTMLLEQVKYFKSHPDILDSLVIDTADWAETLCINHICSAYGKSGIEDFGYGKGYVYLEEEFGRFLNLLNDLIELGINVVTVAHVQMRKFEQPDEMGAYDRWELKLQKKTAPLLKEWADMQLFINYKTYVVSSGDNGKGAKKAQGGKRVIYTSHHPCWDAKNRHGLPEELPFGSPEEGWKQIAHCIPARTIKPVSKPMPEPEPQRAEEVAQDLSEPEPAKTKPTKKDSCSEKYAVENYDDTCPARCTNWDICQKVKEDFMKNQTLSQKELSKSSLTDVPKPLADLMVANNVTAEEIQRVVGKKGYFPADTPIKNYPIEFINGCLVAAWEQVFKMIKESRG